MLLWHSYVGRNTYGYYYEYSRLCYTEHKMKRGGKHTLSAVGFTIVETLIVLAVSAGLFIIAAVYIGGKQQKTQFQVGVRDTQTLLQQTMATAESGYYGNLDDFKCSLVGGATADLTFSGSGGELGARGECVYIGKAIVLSGSTMYTFSLAGTRINAAGFDSTNPKEARATVVKDSVGNSTLPNGLQVLGHSLNGAAFEKGAVGYMYLSSMANQPSSNVGSQYFRLYRVSDSFTSVAETDKNAMATIINNEKRAGTPFQLASSYQICLARDGDPQSAIVTIGGSNSSSTSIDYAADDHCGKAELQ